MTYLEILIGFEREINKLDDTANKPATDDSLYWLNQAVAKFCKLRTNGDFIHQTGYEETEKRFSDLKNLLTFELLKQVSSNVFNPSYNEYEYTYPKQMMYTLSETFEISDTNGQNKINVPVFECTADSFMYRVNNSLTDFHYRGHYARPLRIRTSTGCKLLTDKRYNISKYYLQYLRYPKQITLDFPNNEYSDFSDIILYEIIKIAAQMYIENKSDKRYYTLSNEVNTQE